MKALMADFRIHSDGRDGIDAQHGVAVKLSRHSHRVLRSIWRMKPADCNRVSFPIDSLSEFQERRASLAMIVSVSYCVVFFVHDEEDWDVLIVLGCSLDGACDNSRQQPNPDWAEQIFGHKEHFF